MLDIVQRDQNDIVKQRLVLAQISEKERTNIYKAIRWSFIPHEKLMETSLNSAFDIARPLILEALSLRLVPFESSAKLGSSLNLKPRTKFPDNPPNHAISQADIDEFRSKMTQ